MQGNVYVKCPSIPAAMATVNALHGRWFAGMWRFLFLYPLNMTTNRKWGNDLTFFFPFSRQNDNSCLRSFTDLPQPFPWFSNGKAASNAGTSIVWDIRMSQCKYICLHSWKCHWDRRIEISWLCVIKVASSSCVHHWRLGSVFFSFSLSCFSDFLFVGLCCKLPLRSNLQVSIGLYVFKYYCLICLFKSTVLDLK